MSLNLDVISDIESVAAKGRLLFLIDGLDEITGVSQLATIQPKYSPLEPLNPLELVQSLLSGRLASGAHIIVTSRPHTLTYLQVSNIELQLYQIMAKKTTILGQ